MGWEQRNGKYYYYRKIRRGRQVVSEYLGTGLGAELFAELDQIERDEKLFAADEWKKQKEDVDQINTQLDDSARFIRSIVQAHFLVSGYHPHKGQLRKRRNER